MTNYSAGPFFISDPANFLQLPRSLGGNFRFGCEVIFFTRPAPTFWSRGWFCSFLFLLAGPLFISDPASVLLLPRSLGGNFRLGCGVNCFTTVLLLLAPPTGKLFGARSHGSSFLETTEYRS